MNNLTLLLEGNVIDVVFEICISKAVTRLAKPFGPSIKGTTFFIVSENIGKSFDRNDSTTSQASFA